MAKNYMVIIPVNKEAYLKSFGFLNEAAAIISDKLNGNPTESGVAEIESADITLTMLSAEKKKKNTLPVNERASYYALQFDDIFGTAIILGKEYETIIGLKENDALKIADEINNLRI